MPTVNVRAFPARAGRKAYGMVSPAAVITPAGGARSAGVQPFQGALKNRRLPGVSFEEPFVPGVTCHEPRASAVQRHIATSPHRDVTLMCSRMPECPGPEIRHQIPRPSGPLAALLLLSDVRDIACVAAPCQRP